MIHRLLALIIVASLGIPGILTAQNKGGTIKDSWDRAEREVVRPPAKSSSAPSGVPGVRPPAPEVRSVPDGSAGPAPRDGRYTHPEPWSNRRSAGSRPWPYLPTNPQPKDYHSANAMLIDSLGVLYCVSGSYLRSLSVRNDAAFAPPPPAPARRDFAYQRPAEPPPAAPARESLQALHRELLQLLDQCLNVR